MKELRKIVRGNVKIKQGNEKKADPPPVKRYRISLKTSEDVRRMLSSTLNELRRGEIDVQIGRALIYGGQVLLNVFEQCSLGERLKILEDLVNYGGRR